MITNFSDGYKAKITLSLEPILSGGPHGWRGVCMVYYSSQYTMDTTDGSVCFVAQVSTLIGAGPIDFGTGNLLFLPETMWAPPAQSAAIKPNSQLLMGGKYDIVYAPNTPTKFMFTEGYYASVQWY